MNVLSLFDGISCGRVALERVGIVIDKYFASETNDLAISVSKKNYNDIIHIGDVRDIYTDTFNKIDLLIGGSPCQSFSSAGSMSGMTTTQHIDILTLEQYLELKENGFEFDGYSYLFWEYVRILKELKPMYFLLENVRMAHKWKNIITNALSVEPILINSELVSAQSRPRLYWTNIPGVAQPIDKHIFIDDIIEKDISHTYLKRTRLDYSNYNKSKVDKTTHKNTAIQIGNSRKFTNAVKSNGKAFTLRRINPNGILDKDYNIRLFTPIENTTR